MRCTWLGKTCNLWTACKNVTSQEEIVSLTLPLQEPPTRENAVIRELWRGQKVQKQKEQGYKKREITLHKTQT